MHGFTVALSFSEKVSYYEVIGNIFLKVFIRSLIAHFILGKSIRQLLIAKFILQKSIRQGVFAHLKF